MAVIPPALPPTAAQRRTRAAREAAAQEIERRRCRESAWYFLTHYARTLDAADGGDKGFPAHPYLEEVAHAWQSRDNTIIEKSRQMTVSWTTMALAAWSLVFEPDATTFLGSRTQTEVDDGGINSTVNSLLGKVRFLLDRVPPWLVSADPAIRWHESNYKLLRVTAPHHNGFLAGESANPQMGRGGTYTRALLDEMAFNEYADAAFTSLRQTTKAFYGVSTPNGKHNAFFRLRQLAAAGEGFRLLTLHWSRHPGRDQAWYLRQCAGLTDEQIAQELDISYEKSQLGRVYPEFDVEAHVAGTELPYDPGLPLKASFDFGVNDPTSVLFYQRRPEGALWFVGEYERRRMTPDMHAVLVRDYLTDVLHYTQPVENIVCTGDPTGWSATMTSVIQAWRDEGFEIDTTGIAAHRKIARIIAGRVLLKHRNPPRIQICPVKCKAFVPKMQTYHYPDDTQAGGQSLKQEKPVHDSVSHACDAFEYAVTAETLAEQGDVVDEYFHF